MSDAQELMTMAEEAQRFSIRVKSLPDIVDQATYDENQMLVKDCNEKIREIKDYFKPRKANAQKVLNDWRAAEKASLEPYEEHKGTASQRMAAYATEQKRIAEEIARKAQEEARKAHEEQKARLREEAEKAAEQLGVDPEQLIEDVPMPEVKVEAPKLKGTRENWTYEVTDFAAIPDEYKLVDAAKLNKLAKGEKGKADVPGVRFFSETITSVR